MKRSWSALALSLGAVGGVLVVAMNAVIFTLMFTRLAAEPVDSTKLNHLPVQGDVFRPPSPPLFLSALNIRAADIAMINSTPSPLLRYQANNSVSLASLTKLMTALIIMDNHPDWASVVAFSESDRRGGAKPRIFPGEKISVKDLWRLMLIGSDNDAVAAIIRSLGIDEKKFVARMNQYASELGLANTHFVEPTGLSPENVSTAREFAIIAREALFKKEIAEQLSLLSADITVNGKSRRVYNSDQWLKRFQDASADGWIFVTGKTGHLDEVGYNVALLAENKAGTIISAVILGNPTMVTRLEAVDKLLKWSFEVLAKKSDSNKKIIASFVL